MINRWSSLSLTFVLLFGISLCCKSYDLFLLNEIKALLSVLFGVATACLIISYLWLIQKRPISHESSSRDEINDSPVMHPRGRSISEDSSERQRRFTVCTISSYFDDPPGYEDALVNSKPVARFSNRYPEKTSLNVEPTQNDLNESTSGHLLSDCPFTSLALCNRIQNNLFCSKHSIIDFNNLNNNVSDTHSLAGNNSMAQLALSIVRGFTTLEPIDHQQANRDRISHDHYNQRLDNTHQIQNPNRKFSYCQLDVNQLIVSELPPRYCDLHHGTQMEK